MNRVLGSGALILAFGTALTAYSPNRESAAMPREVTVVGLDYAFQMPRELPAGPTTFRFENKGKVRHEINMVLLKPGAKVDELLALRKEGKSTLHLIDGPVGVLVAKPGRLSSAGLATDLIAGREYAVICAFRDTVDAPRHFEMGMYSVIRVTDANSRPRTTAIPTTTIDGVDYAFKAPATVQPGRRWLAFENKGKVRHEMILRLLRKGATTDSAVKLRTAGGDVDALFEDQQWGLLHAQSGQKALGRFDVNLLPGREYSLLCFFRDSANAPQHVTLGMYGSLKVSPKRMQGSRN